MQKVIDVVIITLSSPVLIGIYEKHSLIETHTLENRVSDSLAEFFESLQSTYSINAILYTNGPGSYMATKLTYIFLKTYQIVTQTPVFAVKGFRFNNNQPIKAVGHSFFIEENGKISVTKEGTAGNFYLPKEINVHTFSREITPQYFLNAV